MNNWITERPSTDVYNAIKYGCSCYVVRYLENIYQKGKDANKTHVKIGSSNIFRDFDDWLVASKFNTNVSFNIYTFSMKMSEYIKDCEGAIKRVKGKTGNMYEFDLDKMKLFLVKKGLLIDNFECML